MTMENRNNGRRLLAMLLAVVMLFSTMPLNTNAATTNSDGYIEIRTIEDLYNIRDDLTAKYILMNDIDLTAATAEGGDWDFMGNGWNPIGSKDVYGKEPFSGELDGNGHSIIGMRIQKNKLPSGTGDLYYGLFAYITGSVHDLKFVGGSITSSSSNTDYKSAYAGALAGYASGATITNVANKMDSISVTIGGYATAYPYSGGICGYAQKTTMSNCFNECKIYAKKNTVTTSTEHDAYAAGIAGYSSGGSIAECYNVGDIVAKGTKYSSNSSYYSTSYGCGITYSDSSSICSVTNCYNAGNVASLGVSSSDAAYGIANGEVSQSYNVGKISTDYSSKAYAIGNGNTKNSFYLKGTGKNDKGSTELTEAQMRIASMYATFDFENIWIQNSAAEACYPYPQLRNQVQDLRTVESVSIAAEPTKTEYRFGEELDLSGSQLKIAMDDGTCEYISITEDMVSGYSPEVPGKQTLTVTYSNFVNTFDVIVNEKVYIPIYTVEDLYNIRDDLSANYILMNDIDLTEATAKGGDFDFGGRGWNPIGSEDIYGKDGVFSGELDGNGHSIIGMRIKFTPSNKPTLSSHTTYFGLFANVSGKIYDLDMAAVNMNCQSFSGSSSSTYYYEYIGAIAAYTSSTAIISNCSVSGTICGSNTNKDDLSYPGGLVSINYGQIEKCNNQASVSCRYAGGIAYENYGTIEQCYNTAEISGGSAGGITNTNTYSSALKGVISNCYNAGAIMGTSYSCGIASTSTSAKIINCYNLGNSEKYAISDTTVTNCYYLDGTGSDASGTVALTEAQMKMQTMFRDFDFETVWVLDPYANYPYPQLRENVQDMSQSAETVIIMTIPYKTEYMVGDPLDFTGGRVKVVYASGNEEWLDITQSMVSGADMTQTGEQTVTVTVNGASDTYQINVAERPAVSSVTIESQPTLQKFAIGTAFDFTGAKAKISYANGKSEIVDITYEMTTGGNINHIGKQTITYTFEGISATFEVEVVGVSLEKIEITALPEKTNYIEGQKLDLTGMVVTAVMSNGEKTVLKEGYTVSGYSVEAGEYTITVSYFGKTAHFSVTVAEKQVVSLRLDALPNKTEYYSGQEFDRTGMQVVASYDNGESHLVADYSISGYDAIPGIKTVVVSMGGQSVSFTVKVIAKVITEMKLTALPSKLTYIANESFDGTGMKVEVTYNDGTSEEVTDYEVIGFSPTVGTYTVAVSYKGFTDSFEITVSPRKLVDLQMKEPIKTTYIVGEAFDGTGMQVIACYDNGEEIEIDGYEMLGFDSRTPGVKEITVTYGGLTRSFAVTVVKKAPIQTNGAISLGKVQGRLGESIEVPVTVTKNNGLTAMCHTITFDPDALKFVSATAENGFADGAVVVNDENAATGQVTVLWFKPTDVVESGVAYTLTFEVLETAQDGISSLGISFDENDNGNANGEDVLFDAVNGSVEVLSYWLGDLDGDRKYGMADLLQLAQYVSGKEMTLTEKQKKAADVNEDGVIDIHDVTLLSQWLLAAEM